MEYAKIVVKNNYEKRGDLVLRSYVRALRKIYAGRLLDGDNGLVYGVVDDNNLFHEMFTNRIINYDNYVLVGVEEIFDVALLPEKKQELYKKIVDRVLFGKDIDLDFEISTIEDLARDRAIEFDAYDNYLSRINPYQRLNEENPDAYNDYNNFLRKIEEINLMKKVDSKVVEKDEYEISDYQSKPASQEDYDYLVFEVPKVYKKK